MLVKLLETFEILFHTVEPNYPIRSNPNWLRMVSVILTYILLTLTFGPQEARLKSRARPRSLTHLLYSRTIGNQ